MASLSTCYLGLWLGWQILLNYEAVRLLSCNDYYVQLRTFSVDKMTSNNETTPLRPDCLFLEFRRRATVGKLGLSHSSIIYYNDIDL